VSSFLNCGASLIATRSRSDSTASVFPSALIHQGALPRILRYSGSSVPGLTRRHSYEKLDALNQPHLCGRPWYWCRACSAGPRFQCPRGIHRIRELHHIGSVGIAACNQVAIRAESDFGRVASSLGSPFPHPPVVGVSCLRALPLLFISNSSPLSSVLPPLIRSRSDPKMIFRCASVEPRPFSLQV